MRAKARISESALRTARLIGFGAADIVAFVQTMTQRDFVKSVTSLSDHRQWQDVYNVPHDGTTIYIKFTDRALAEMKAEHKARTQKLAARVRSAAKITQREASTLLTGSPNSF